MRAALYLRRSTEDHQAESLETQLDNARRFCEARGWDVVAVFTDDGISRAEFKRRRGLIDLLNLAEVRGFDIAVTRDETRIGGDMIRTGLVIQDLIDHGARLFYYTTGEEVRLDDATARFIVAAKNFSSELEREKIASRTREHLERQARRGFVAGGVTYGYDNFRTPDGVRRVVNEHQAAVVRDIFERAAGGEGVRAIAQALNRIGIAAPRAQTSGTGSWGSGAIHAILRRPLYVGRIEWGKTHKAYRRGTKVRLDEHAHQLVREEAPELRIVSAELWEDVQSRMRRHTEATGSTRKGTPARYLLTGFSRCATCGGPIQVERVKVSYENVPAYKCAWHRDRGNTVCTNTLRRPVAAVDRAVIAWIQEHVLSERVVRAVLRGLRAALDAAANPAASTRERLEGEARRLRGELARLAAAVAATSAPIEALVVQLEERQRRLRAAEAQLAAAAGGGKVLALSGRRIEERARARLAELGELLGAHPAGARKVVQALLVGPLRWTPTKTPEGRRYEIRGDVALGRLVLTEKEASGVVLASPAGFDLSPIAIEVAA